MSEVWVSVLVAIITGGFSLAGVVISNRKSHDKTIESITTEVKLIQRDISNLEKKQDKHNTLIERMYALEKTVNVLEERVNNNSKKIDEDK